MTAAEMLREMVLARAGNEAEWMQTELDRLKRGAPERDLHIFMGLAPRRLGKANLRPTAEESAAVERAVSGWSVEEWSVDGAARVLALLFHAGQRPFAERFKDLRRTADASELIALFRGLPLYPEPEALHFEVGEGLRSNLKPVFEAIAHHNPFPRDHFEEHRWNHMILKALFIDSRLAPIVGLDERANPDLARILREYAHERWAAGRPVAPELWRCVGPFAADEAALADLVRALSEGGASGRAAALALSISPAPQAHDILAGRPEEDEIAAGRLDWHHLEETA
ncbi:EboA domain-containing protein [Loktanella sp. DJP18]|uniref:EboA domain-containing protein n=1 Tax=Loktanella sp. DJP18 TaxID=3409788 RepID=UPI003BB673B7